MNVYRLCAERSAGHGYWRDQRLSDLGFVDVPAQVGRGMPPALRPSLPAQRSGLVRQVQVFVRVAAGRPRSTGKGITSFQLGVVVVVVRRL